MTQYTEKHPGGRPTKLTEEFVGAMMDVVNSENNALINTDEELIFLINEQLPAEGRIHADTFSLWKNGRISDDVRAQKFVSVYKKALLKQKTSLFGKMDDPKNPAWQKEAWKIERPRKRDIVICTDDSLCLTARDDLPIRRPKTAEWFRLLIGPDSLHELCLGGFQFHEQSQNVQDIEQFGSIFGQPVVGLNVAELGRGPAVTDERPRP